MSEPAGSEPGAAGSSGGSSGAAPEGGEAKKEINMMEFKTTVQKLPLLKVKAGPRDGDAWVERLKEEYLALIAYQKMNKEAGNDWFTIESNKTGTKWTGKVWFVHNLLRYEFDLEFELPVTYPGVPPELALPEIDGKTEKMYRGGKICLDSHFRPLWARNVPHFGLAHAMALGMAPWLAAEVPHLVAAGRITHQDGKK